MPIPWPIVYFFFEHQIYAKAVKACVTGRVRYENERAVMDDETALELTLFGKN